MQRVRVLLAAAELRQQTPCPLTPSTLATPSSTLMGKHFCLSSGWQLVFSLSQSLLAYNSISCPRRVCLAALMSWWHRWHCVQVSWCLCREGTSGRGRCWVSTEAETIGSMPGEDGATIHYYPLSSTIYWHLLSAPPITPAQNSTTTNHIYFNLFYILRYNFVNGNLLLWPGKLDSNEVMFAPDTSHGSTAPELSLATFK